MALASHMVEYFGKILALEQWGYENCQKMGVSCWNRLYEGTLFRLVCSVGFLQTVSSLGSWRPSED